MTTPRLPRYEEQKGSALVMAAIVLLLLTTMGITLLFVADSDAKMNQAGIRTKKAFFIAEAGLEAGREQLRLNNLASTNPKSLSDELYVASGSNHAINLNEANLKPTYDANGNVTGFTGYGDDTPIKAATTFGGGYYAAFLTNDPIDGKTNLTDSNKRVMITAIGAGRNQSVEIVQAIVVPNQLPPFPSAITLLGPTANFDGGSSNAKYYTGTDCSGASGYTGVPGLNVPVVGTIGTASEATAEVGVRKPANYSSGTSTGLDTVTDVSSTIDPAWTDCQTLRELADEVRAAADYVCTAASPCSHWNTSTINTVTFVDGDLDLSGGKGVLWVTGDLTVHGNTSWEGIILVVGKGGWVSSGGGNGKLIGTVMDADIAGPDGVYGTGDDCTGGTAGFNVATFFDDGNGNHDTIYCSDAISKAMFSFPMKVASFRQR
jgi:Tfp pilus assembly protein PilX